MDKNLSKPLSCLRLSLVMIEREEHMEHGQVLVFINVEIQKQILNFNPVSYQAFTKPSVGDGE